MKVNIILNKKNEVIGYRSYPFDLACPTIDLEDFPQDLVVGDYKFENNKIIRKTDSDMDSIVIVSSVRFTKENLMRAFTEYRNDVNYGLIAEDEITHQKMIKWYRDVNNDDMNSINNPPANIIKYLEANL